MWRVVVSLLVFCWALLSISSLYGQRQPKEQIEAQIERMERIWKAAPASEQTAYELQRLGRSRKALQSGYLYASLYYLQTVMADAVGLQYSESRKELEKAGFDAFEKEWQTLGSQLSEEEKSLTDARLAALPAAVRALVQAAQEQSRTYHQAGRLYARETTIPYGLHYIGNAKGFLDFATWSAGLPFTKRQAGAARSPEKEIMELEREVLQAYARPDAAKQQPQFNDISSQLKFAGDLARQGKSVAALETYLEASRLFGLLDAPAAQPSDFNKFQTQARAFKARFDAGLQDESVGQMYWEIVQLKLAAGAADNKLSDADARQVAVILDSVLPRYFQYAGSSNTAATATAPVSAASNAKVKVTLVRWPYT